MWLLVESFNKLILLNFIQGSTFLSNTIVKYTEFLTLGQSKIEKLCLALGEFTYVFLFQNLFPLRKW